MFASMVPPTENIAVAIWWRLDGKSSQREASASGARFMRMPEFAYALPDFYGEGA